MEGDITIRAERTQSGAAIAKNGLSLPAGENTRRKSGTRSSNAEFLGNGYFERRGMIYSTNQIKSERRNVIPGLMSGRLIYWSILPPRNRRGSSKRPGGMRPFRGINLGYAGKPRQGPCHCPPSRSGRRCHQRRKPRLPRHIARYAAMFPRK